MLRGAGTIQEVDREDVLEEKSIIREHLLRNQRGERAVTVRANLGGEELREEPLKVRSEEARRERQRALI